MKLLVQVVVTTLAGIGGNIIAAFIVADVWSNVFTPARIWGTAIALVVAFLILMMLDSNVMFFWSWPWHLYWYRRELVSDPRIRRWAERFGVLDFLRKNRPLLRAEVIKEGTHAPLPLTQTLKEDVLANQTNAQRVIVVGEPGSGKTTGLERLAWELASERPKFFGSVRLPVLVRLNNL